MAIAYNALRGLGLGAQGASLGTLAVNFVGDTSQLLRELERATAATTSFSTRILGAAGIIATGVAVAAATAGAAVAALGVRQYAKFEQEMTKASAIFGGLNDEVRSQLEATAKTLSLHTTQDAVELAKGYQTLASAGLSASQAEKALGVASRFAIAGSIDLAKATDYLLGVQSALKLSSEDVTKNMQNMIYVSDALAKANNISKGTIEDFAAALTNRGAAALTNAHKSLEEGIAILAVFADRNIKGAAAGQQLMIALRDLQRVAISNTQAFDKYSVHILDSQGNMRNMADLVGDLERAFGSMSVAQRRQALQEMGFQDRSSQSILTLIGYSAQLRKHEEQMKSASGTTKKMSDEILGTLINQLTMLWNSFKNLVMTVGQHLTPGLKVLTKLFTDMADPETGMGMLVEQIAKFIGLNFSLEVEGLNESMRKLGLIALEVGRILIHSFIENFDSIQAHLIPLYNNMVRFFNLMLSMSKFSPFGMLATKGIQPLATVEGFDLSGLRKEAETLTAKLDLAHKKLMGWVPPETKKDIIEVTKDISDLGEQLKKLAAEQNEARRKADQTMDRMGIKAKIPFEMEGELQEGKNPEDRARRKMSKVEMGLEMKMGSDNDKILENRRDLDLYKEHLEALKKISDAEIGLNNKTHERKLQMIEIYNRRLLNLRMNEYQMILGTTSQMFNDMSTIAEAFGGKQSAMYKAMFAASKAFAIAESTVKIMQGIANAAAMPWPLNLLAIGQVIAATASIVSNIQATKLEFAGGKATGGPVHAGKAYMVGERGQELFVPNTGGTIVPNDQLGGRTRVIVNNYTDGTPTVSERNDGTEKVIEVMIKRVKNDLATEVRDGHGNFSRSMERTFGLRRGLQQT